MRVKFSQTSSEDFLSTGSGPCDRGAARLAFAVLALLMLFGSVQLHAQSAKMRKADRLFDAFRFAEASILYQEVLEEGDNPMADLRLAECYRLTNMPELAEAYYARVLDQMEVVPVFYLHYAQVLHGNGKCGEALGWYRKYASLRPDDIRGITLPASCEDIAFLLQQEGSYELLPADINSPADELSPVMYRNGIVFTSNRPVERAPDEDGWSGKPYLQLFFAPGDKNLFEFPTPLSRRIRSPFHDGPATFNGTGNTMFFSRNNPVRRGAALSTDGVSKLQLWRSNLVDTEWDRFEILPFCEPDYNYTHPAVTPDGRTLYFASDRPGGMGGMDLWVSNFRNDQWSEPENLGEKINSPGNDVFPFVHDDGSLYFASDGHPGLGGLDIFVASWRYGRFEDPANLRSPVNSNRDDFGLVLGPDREQGYFSSNRDGGEGGDDIYSLTRFPLFVSGTLVDAETLDPLSEGRITVMRGGEVLHRLGTDEKGFFLIRTSPFETYQVTGYHEGYNPADITLETGTDNRERILLPLERLIPPDRALALSVKIIDRESKRPMRGEEIRLRNLDRDTERILEADDDGLCEVLIDKQQHYQLSVVGLFLHRTETLDPGMMDESVRLTRILELEPFELNRPYHLEITYEHAEFELDWDARLELDRLVRLMKENSGLTIEIGSHTDANGTDATNNRVSQRRAETVVDYLVAQGIGRERLSAVGYGESQLLNHCANGVICPEELHQENRRTEYTILEYVPQ